MSGEMGDAISRWWASLLRSDDLESGVGVGFDQDPAGCRLDSDELARRFNELPRGVLGVYVVVEGPFDRLGRSLRERFQRCHTSSPCSARAVTRYVAGALVLVACLQLQGKGWVRRAVALVGRGRRAPLITFGVDYGLGDLGRAVKWRASQGEVQ